MEVLHADPKTNLFLRGEYAFKRRSEQKFHLDFPLSVNMPKVAMWFVDEKLFESYIHGRKNGKLPYPGNLTQYQQIELVPEIYPTEFEDVEGVHETNRATFALETSDKVGVYLITVIPEASVESENSQFHVVVANRDPSVFPAHEDDDLAELIENHLKIWDRYGNIWFGSILFFVEKMLLIKLTPELKAEMLNDPERPEGFPYPDDVMKKIASGYQELGIGRVYIEVEKPGDDEDEIPCMDLEYMRETKPKVIT